MKLRFRTRVSLTISILLFLTIAAMSVLIIAFMVPRVSLHYYRMGERLNNHAVRNIQYGLSLPRRVLEHVQDQMAVNTLLAAELVAAAEAGADPESAEMIQHRLQRVLDRAEALHGYSLADEFWITDETGKAYINTEDLFFDFNDYLNRKNQARDFLPLLKGDADIVLQPPRPREIDAQPFLYTAAAGVDKPRIVQTGAGRDLLRAINTDFHVQHLIDRFMTGMQFERIALLDAGGNILAASGAPQKPGQGIADAAVRAFCLDFLNNSASPWRTQSFGNDIGVVTSLHDPATDEPLALFIQHRAETGINMIHTAMLYILLVGSALIGAGAIAGIFISRGLTRPLEALMEGTHAITSGDLDHRIQLKRKDEFQGVAQSFNRMAVSLQQQLHQLRQETAGNERLMSELRIAADVQQSLLPKEPPEVPGYELDGWSREAKQVGGDFFDFIRLEDGSFCVALADATGKGMPAALLTVQCWSMLRTLAHDAHTPAQLLRRTNRELYKRISPSYRFVTLFFLNIRPESGIIRYAAAGHNPPLLISAANTPPKLLKYPPALPLGIEKDTQYTDYEHELNPGETLLIYSDGLMDARNSTGKTYSTKDLQHVITRAENTSLKEFLKMLRRDIEHFTFGCETVDDMTVAALRYNPVKDDTAAT
jgi:serine phosphatase RsbU (regulator of sigma subunit)